MRVLTGTRSTLTHGIAVCCRAAAAPLLLALKIDDEIQKARSSLDVRPTCHASVDVISTPRRRRKAA